MSTPLPPEWDSWLQEGARLAAAPPLRRNEQSTCGSQDPKFAWGDFLLRVPAECLEALAEALHQDPSQLHSYREVAEAVAPERRVAASWSVHRNLRNRTELLRDGLTVREANVLIGGKPIDSKPDSRLSVEQRAAKVRDGLADPEVYALIDRELAASRTERKLRSRARNVVSEYAKRGQELEAELRALRNAKSPFEVTVKAELEVNRAIQFVHAIGETLDDLPQQERIISALKDLNVEIAKVLVVYLPSGDGADSPIVIDGEVWQDQPARATLIGSNQEDLSGEGRPVIELIDDGPP